MAPGSQDWLGLLVVNVTVSPFTPRLLSATQGHHRSCHQPGTQSPMAA